MRQALAWLFAGALAALPFHGGWVEPLALVTPVPWLLLAASAPGLTFLRAWTSGIGFVLAGLPWLHHVHPVAAAVAALHFGLYVALAPWAIARLKAAGWPLLAAAPLAVLGYEALLQRACFMPTTFLSHGTLTWRVTPLAQLAAVGGTALLAGLAWLVPAGLADSVLAARAGGPGAGRRLATWRPALLGLAIAGTATAIGAAMVPSVEPGRRVARLALVQGNIPQEVRVRPSNLEDIIRAHARLSVQDTPEGTDLVVWPESTAMLALEQDEEARIFLGRVAARVGAPLLLGAIGVNGDGPPSNSAFLVDESGRIVGRSDKRFLVPGAETLLFLDLIPALRDPIGNFLSRTMHFRPFLKRGGEGVVLDASGFRFGVLICYDDVVSPPAERQREAGAQALITVTNEAWFGRGELRQHLALAVFRCIETRLPMARCGNDGVTCTIDPAGRVTGRLPSWTEGVLAGDLLATGARPVPPRVRLAVQAAGVAVLAGALVRARRRTERLVAQDAPGAQA